MTTELGNEVRAEVAKILARFSGLDIAAVKVSTLKNVASVLDAEDMRAKACTCGAHQRQFQIPGSCDAAPYEAMSRARIDRMHQVDEAIAGRSVL